SDNAADYDERALKYLRYFFNERSRNVEFAEFEDEDRIRLVFVEDGVEKTLRLNLKNGYSNVVECM
ncbi:MAG: hypothetical protein IJ133_07240, partial [Clostridia bacterium]|nr:hypothetical protein [Clostridia bacterium]